MENGISDDTDPMNVDIGDDPFESDRQIRSDACVSTDSCETLLEVELSTAPGCVLSTFDRDAEVIYHSQESGKCQVLLDTTTEGEHDVLRGETIDLAACPMAAMKNYRVVPHVTSVTEDGVVVEGYVEDSSVIWPMLEELRSVTESMSILRIVSLESEADARRRRMVNLDAMTDKQLEALELAYERGYFERPRQVTQEALANELDISKQALSRRLSRVEKVVFDQLIGP
jgi:predicted DNA binding protein